MLTLDDGVLFGESINGRERRRSGERVGVTLPSLEDESTTGRGGRVRFWAAEDFADPVELINLGSPRKERPQRDKFGEDGADSPHINGT